MNAKQRVNIVMTAYAVAVIACAVGGWLALIVAMVTR